MSFIRLSRKFFEHPFWSEDREYSKGEAWLDLIQFARFEPSAAIVNGKVIELQRGELCASIRFLAKRWSWGEQKVRTYLDTCKRLGMITHRQHSGESILTLVKYGSYNERQHSDNTESNTPITQQQHTDNTAITQSKERKKVKNEKESKEIRIPDEPGTVVDKIDFEKLLLFFNETFNKNSRSISDGNKAKYNLLLKKGYKKADIMIAMQNASKDPFHQGNGFKHTTLEFFAREDKIDKFLNFKPTQNEAKEAKSTFNDYSAYKPGLVSYEDIQNALKKAAK